ncbi:MAG TPA: hypothetical protein DCZ48_12505 [Methylococcaceae bacterium]|nr:hypothetical protein [Methylococcaceae bacterium]
MPVEERREPILGGLTAAPCCRHPRQACPTPCLIPKLGIAVAVLRCPARLSFMNLSRCQHFDGDIENPRSPRYSFSSANS